MGAGPLRHGGRRLLAAVSVLAIMLCAASCTAGDDPRRSPAPETVTETVTEPVTRYAPYVDVTMRRPRLTDVADATGQREFTLAFILADGERCTPTWGDVHPLDDPRILGQVRALRERGGSVVVSSGGADGPYLETACRTAGALTRAYERALDVVGTDRLDVDVEAGLPVERVNSALARLQERRGTRLTYTLQVQDERTGLTAGAMKVLRSAARHDLDVTVNAMVMNFPYSGDWGEAMTSAADAVVRQLRTVWPDREDAALYRMLGLTPMIGRNDSGMVTTKHDARTLVRYARAHRIGFLAFWSVARDNGSCRRADAIGTCSGIAQSRYEFTEILRPDGP